MQERLQKLISRAGVASRRKAEELIAQGAVEVNGEIITELGAKADPDVDRIRVKGRRILAKPTQLVYLALNKPKGYVTTTDDPEGRRTVMDLVGKPKETVYPVGRLDYQTEGLLLLTNDGELANFLTSAKNHVPKTYAVKVNGHLTVDQLEKFRSGMMFEGRKTAPAKIRLQREGKNPWYEVTIIEGRNRQIRKMFLRMGLLVEKIRRTQLGPLKLGKLPLGTVRSLTEKEREQLRAVQKGLPVEPTRERRPRRAAAGQASRRKTSSGRSAPSRNTSSRNTAPRKTSSREASSSGRASRDTPLRGAPPRKDSSRNAPSGGAPARKSSGRKGPPRKPSSRKGPQR